MNYDKNNIFAKILRGEISCKKVYEDRIYEDLYWLGLKWEEDVIIQSDRIQLYESYLKFLNDKGFIYGCRCSRSDIKNALSALSLPENSLNTFIYPGTCKEKNLNIWRNNVRIDIDKIRDFLNRFADKEKVFETILLNKLEGFYSDLGWKLSTNPYVNQFFI